VGVRCSRGVDWPRPRSCAHAAGGSCRHKHSDDCGWNLFRWSAYRTVGLILLLAIQHVSYRGPVRVRAADRRPRQTSQTRDTLRPCQSGLKRARIV
jgi:hypothetical protein